MRQAQNAEETTINLCSLNMQEKIDCNKMNEITEERNANLIYTGSATSRAYV